MRRSWTENRYAIRKTSTAKDQRKTGSGNSKNYLEKGSSWQFSNKRMRESTLRCPRSFLMKSSAYFLALNFSLRSDKTFIMIRVFFLNFIPFIFMLVPFKIALNYLLLIQNYLTLSNHHNVYEEGKYAQIL